MLQYFKKFTRFPATRSALSKLHSPPPQCSAVLVTVLLTATTVSMFTLHCRRFLELASPPSARFSPGLCFSQYTKIVQKRVKPSAVESEPSSPPSCPLSPEQLDRIARNKKAALERLSSAQTPPGFGESWRKGLSAEFGKPYFKQVRTSYSSAAGVSGVFGPVFMSPCVVLQLTSFVSDERKRHTVYPPAEDVFTWTQMCDIRDVREVALALSLTCKILRQSIKLLIDVDSIEEPGT